MEKRKKGKVSAQLRTYTVPGRNELLRLAQKKSFQIQAPLAFYHKNSKEISLLKKLDPCTIRHHYRRPANFWIKRPLHILSNARFPPLLISCLNCFSRISIRERGGGGGRKEGRWGGSVRRTIGKKLWWQSRAAAWGEIQQRTKVLFSFLKHWGTGAKRLTVKS